MSETGPAQASTRADTSSAAPDRSPPRWLVELREALASMRELAAAHWALLGAEFRLARVAAHTAMLAALGAVVFAVALGLTLLALLGWILAQWFGSWAWALLALAALQLLGMLGAIVLFRRCLHWMSFPRTRAQAGALMQQSTASTAGANPDAGGPDIDTQGMENRGGEGGTDTRTG